MAITTTNRITVSSGESGTNENVVSEAIHNAIRLLLFEIRSAGKLDSGRIGGVFYSIRRHVYDYTKHFIGYTTHEQRDTTIRFDYSNIHQRKTIENIRVIGIFSFSFECR